MTALDRLSLPVIVLLAAALWLAHLLNLIPSALSDLLGRAAPALLIALGLALLLGRRARYGNLIALGATLALVSGVAVISFNREAGAFREDYVETLDYTLPPNVVAVRLSAELRRTAISVRAAEGRALSGEFRGSFESLLTPSYRVEGDVAVLTIQETRREGLLTLEQVGRGRLTLNLPAAVAIEDLTISAAEGDLALEAERLTLRNVQIRLSGGDLSAQFGRSVGLLADLKASGAIAVRIPAELAAEIALRGNGARAPRFDEAIYTRRIDNVLVPSGAAETQAQLTLEAGGTITVE
jgi:hypothetical protein